MLKFSLLSFVLTNHSSRFWKYRNKMQSIIEYSYHSNSIELVRKHAKISPTTDRFYSLLCDHLCWFDHRFFPRSRSGYRKSTIDGLCWSCAVRCFFFRSLSNDRVCVFRLWADVTDCLAPACGCTAKIEGSVDESQPLQLRKEKKNLGFVVFSGLKANTLHPFTLTCEQGQNSVSLKVNITTDYGRPEPPQNVTVSVATDHVQISWSAPSVVDSFDYYKIVLDGNLIEANLTKKETSFEINQVWNENIYFISVSACHLNKQGLAMCSNGKDASVSFTQMTPTTSTITTTTTTETTTTNTSTSKSSGVLSYSISIPTILSSLYLLRNI